MLEKNNPFRPAKGFSNRHLQTLIPVVLGRYQTVSYTRTELTLPDGDFVDLDWTSLPEPLGVKPVLIIFHGLEGSSSSHYAKALMKVAQDNDWHAVVMNFRSCSGRQNREPRLYHSGETGDAHFFIDWLKEQFPLAPLYAAGFSLGGNMLLKLAGEQGSALALDALVSVSAPIKLDEATRYMVQGLPRLYQAHLLKTLKRKLLEKYTQHDYRSIIGLDRRDLINCKDIREFDNLFTARLHGFENAEDYYARSSAFPLINQISKPCLILHAKDDPIAPSSILPDDASMPDHVQLEVTRKGGHVGFLGGSIARPGNWLPSRILAYFSEYLANK